MVAWSVVGFVLVMQTGVTVDAERLRLFEVLPQVALPWADLDLGASPAPGEAFWLDAKTIHRAVERAQLGALPVRIPRRIRITRSSQQIDALRLRAMVEEALEGRVDAASVRSITVRGGVLMPHGAVFVDVDPPPTWRDGQQTLLASLRSAHGRSVTFPVIVAYQTSHRKNGKALVQRGNAVTIRLRQGRLLVEAAGVAQENGEMDAVIAVLSARGGKMLRGRVVDAHSVEVTP